MGSSNWRIHASSVSPTRDEVRTLPTHAAFFGLSFSVLAGAALRAASDPMQINVSVGHV